MDASVLPRRTFLKHSLAIAAATASADTIVRAAEPAAAAPPIAIGSRRELFIDDFLIERLVGKAEQRLHEPQPREVAIVHDAPWEGTASGYHSVFQDGDRYRMYYRGWNIDIVDGKLRTDAHPPLLCYAESDDGIHWRKPELGVHDFRGSKANNIMMTPEQLRPLEADVGESAVFRDDRPATPLAARYKAVIHSLRPFGLLIAQSPDGIRWSLLSNEPVITAGGFDSQNLAYWDAALGEYRAYWRYWTAGETKAGVWKPSGIRGIRTARSQDLVHWTDQADLSYDDSPNQQMYTSGIKPYFRAPHILLGFPMRYVDRGWSDSMRALPELEHRELRAAASRRYGTAITEGLLMTSRDGVRFKRWSEAFFRPGLEREGTWQYAHHSLAWQLVETKSTLAEGKNELSFYSTESYWTGTSSALRRYTLRLDGFVSIRAPLSGGEVVTKPLTFSGQRLSLNFSTSAAGRVRVELQNLDGSPVPGFSLNDCNEIFGDTHDRTVVWKSTEPLASLAGRPLRIRFELQDADLYSFCFA